MIFLIKEKNSSPQLPTKQKSLPQLPTKFLKIFLLCYFEYSQYDFGLLPLEQNHKMEGKKKEKRKKGKKRKVMAPDCCFY
jgi:hypothetical protein